MKTIFAFVLSIAMISLLISSYPASAMEQSDHMSDKKSSDKTDKKMTDKKMTDKKITDKKDTKKKSDKKKMVKKDTAKKTDKTTDKKMMEKKMVDKMEKIHAAPKSIGGVDLSMASPIQGSPDAKITIIEFGDYQCPKCYSWFTMEKPKIESQYISTGKANLVFVDLSFLGSDSDSASIASYCADEQGKYWQYHSTLYKNQGGIQSGWASNANLKKFASDLGLDSAKFDACLDSAKYSDRIKHNGMVSSSSGAHGTPTFLIVGPNGVTEKISGPQPSSVFSGVIDKMLK